MAVPNVHAVAVLSTFSAGDVNQFLGTHASLILRDGASKVTYTATATGNQYTYASGGAQWLAQPFSTAVGQTTISHVDLVLAGGAGTWADTVLQLRTDDGSGNPSSTILWSCPIPADFFSSGAGVWVSIPCNVTGLVGSTMYHLVLTGTTDATNYDDWQTAATSVNAGLKSATGAGSWSSVSATFLFQVFDGNQQGNLRHVIEDCPVGGPPARWTGVDYNAAGQPVTIREVCGSLRSVRTLTYIAGQLTSVS